MGSIMKYTAQMGFGAKIYISSLVKIGSGVQKLTGQDSQTYRKHGSHISLLPFFF